MNSFVLQRSLKRAAMAMLLQTAAWMPALQAQSWPFQEIFPSDGTVAYLGIRMEDVTPENMADYRLTAERGVIVRSVEKGSPAEEALLQENDVILEYSGIEVFSSMQLARMVRETPPGRRVGLVVSRDGKTANLSARIGKRNEAGAGGRSIIVRPRGPDGRSFEFRIPERVEPPGIFLPRLGDGDAERPRLGVTLQPLTDQMAEFLGVPKKNGALITSTAAGSPAAGKLLAGDVIIQADGRSIETPEDLIQLVRRKNEGAIEFRVIRDKKEISVTVELPKQESQPRGGFKL